MKKVVLFHLLNLMAITVFSQNCAVNAGTDQTICVGQPLTLTGIPGNPQSTPPFYQWIQLAGPTGAIITSPNTTTTTVTGSSPGVYIFELSNRCADNLLSRDIVAITVLPLPPTALAGPDVSQCSNTPVSLNANAVTIPNTGAWSVSPAGGTFSPNVNSPNATYTPPAGSGTYTLTWTISNGFCSSADNMQIRVVQPTTPVNAGPDQTLSCNGSCTTLSGSNPGLAPPQSGLWTMVSGPSNPVIVSPTSAATQACALVPGTYVFRWSVNGPCHTGSDEVTITVNNIFDAPTSASASYTNFCNSNGSSTQVLSGTPLTAGETGVWTLTSGQAGVTFSPNNTSANVTANGLTGTFPYTFTWVKTNAAGCSATGTHTVHRNPTVTNLTTPSDQELACNATSTTFTLSYDNSANVTSGLTRNGIRISGPSTIGAISFSNSTTSGATRTDTWSVTGMTIPGTYVFRVEYRNSCGSQFRDISITTSVTPGAVNAGSDIRLPCNTLTANPIGSAATPGTFTWSQVSGPNAATLSGVNTLSLNMSGLTAGVYRMRLSISGGKTCPAKSDDMLVFVTTAVPTIATTGADATICAGRYRLTANTPGLLETGTWTVTPSAGISFSPNANTPNAIATGMSVNTAYTFRWTVSNACGSIFSQQVLTTNSTQAPPIANAGADQCIAAGISTTTLNGNAPAGSTITWTALDAGSSVSPTNTQSTTATLTASGSFRFEYALSTPGCTVMRDTVVITRNQAITANAGADIDVCAAATPTSTTLTGSAIPSGTTATWTQLSGPVTAVIASPNTASTLLSGLQAGIYEFEYRIGNGGVCPDVTDIVIVRVVSEPSAANAGSDQSICNATTATTVTLAAVAPTVGSGYWQIVTGPTGSTPTFSNQNANNSTISNLMNGSYTLRWTTTNGPGCTDKTDDVVLNITAAANAKPDFNVCAATTTSLSGNPNTNGTWSYVSATPGGTPAPSISDNATNEYAAVSGLTVPTNNTPTVYTFRYTLPAVGACPLTFDDATITNYATPSQSNAGADIELCFNTSTVTLTGNTPAIGIGNWIRESGPNTPTAGATNTNKADTVLNNIIPGLYIYRYEVNTNAVCIASVDKVQVIKEAAANAKPDIRLCSSNTVNLNATPAVVNIGTWSQVSGPNTPTFNNLNAPNAIVNGLVAGTYIFRWTVASNAIGCPTNSDEVTVIIDPAVPTMDAGTDVTACEGTLSPFQIGSAAQSGVTYTWTPAALLSSTTIAQPTFNGVNNAGTYTYTVKGTIGVCEAFDQVVVKINPKPFSKIGITSSGCSNVTVNALNPGPGINSPTYSWNYGTGATPATGTGAGPNTVSYAGGIGSKTITLTLTSAEGCSSTATYDIGFWCYPLPVNLGSFDVSWKDNSYTELLWKILSAANFSHFIIERSSDGNNYNVIGQVPFNNNTNFRFDDRSINTSGSKYYYRLKMVDKNGDFKYSEVRLIYTSRLTSIKIAPNPFSEKIGLWLNGNGEKVTILLFAANGQLVYQNDEYLNRGNQFIEINKLDKLPAGLYKLTLFSNNLNFSEKVIKK